MIIKYYDNNENRIYWQHRRGGEWRTAELDELIEAYERATEPGDLISRDAAMNIFAVDLAEKDRRVSYHGFCIDAAMAIGSLPSAEKTGKWIPVTNGRGGFECNKCHNYAPSYQDGVEWLSDFCPNCGARMVD